MQTFSWYQELVKPEWAPPAWLFGPVWTVLYILITLSFGTVFFLVLTKTIPWRIAIPFFLNLLFNFAFSPIQFSLQNNLLAAVDILFVLATLVWGIIWIYPYKKWIAYVQIPYLLWVSFATILQLTITVLNF